MTPRQVRRAAERKARKQERKAANGFVFSSEPAATTGIPESPIQFPVTPIQSPERSDGPKAFISAHLPLPDSPPTARTPNSPPAHALPKVK